MLRRAGEGGHQTSPALPQGKETVLKTKDDSESRSPVSIGGVTPDSRLRDLVERLSGQKVADCYQCGECTAGCPVAFAMDLMPNQVTRLVQLGLAEEVLACRTIWLCAGCQTCVARCPQLVEPSAIMDALRQIAAERGIKAPEGEIEAFHKAFLNSVERSGRVHEMGMIAELKLKTRKFVKDVPVGLGLFTKGKLSPLPKPVKDRAAVKKIFKELRKHEETADE